MHRRKPLLSLVYALEIDTLAHGDGTGHGRGLADLHGSVELGKTSTTAGLGCSSSEEFLEHIREFYHEGFQCLCVTAGDRLENEPGNLEDILILAGVVEKVASKILDDDLFRSRKAGADLLCDVLWSDHGRGQKTDQRLKFARSERLPFRAVCGLVFPGGWWLVRRESMAVGCRDETEIEEGVARIPDATPPDAVRASMPAVRGTPCPPFCLDISAEIWTQLGIRLCLKYSVALRQRKIKKYFEAESGGRNVV